MLYVDGKSVDSGQLQGSFLYIDSLERLFLGGVPKDFVAKQVPVSRFPASLTGGMGGGGRGGGFTKPIGWGIYEPR